MECVRPSISELKKIARATTINLTYVLYGVYIDEISYGGQSSYLDPENT